MSWLDASTLSVVTALVVVVAGLLFLVDTVVHAGSAAARIWSLGFMAGILTVMAYLAWTFLPDGWVVAAIGNAAFVTTTGCMWLGCRRYNGRAMLPSSLLVSGAAVSTLGATLSYGADGGAWAGAAVMFLWLGVLAGFGAVEARRGALAGRTQSFGVTIVLALQCAFYVARTYVYLTSGPESEVFVEWFGTATTSLLTITFTITIVISVAILRATERAVLEPGEHTAFAMSTDGILDDSSFERVLRGILPRAAHSGEQVAVIAMRIDDHPQISTAFGARAGEQILARWRTGLIAALPLTAFIGQHEPHAVTIGVPVQDETSARHQANRISQRVLDELTDSQAEIIPVMGIGVALGEHESDASSLIEDAHEAAARSAVSLDASVIVAEPRRPREET